MGRLAAAGTAFERRDSLSSRSAAYSLLSKAFAFPGEQFHAETRAGLWTGRLSAAIHGLPYKLPTAAVPQEIPEDYDVFQSEYIRLFEVGACGSAPCPLYSGHYSRDRTRSLQDLIRFYNFFGLSMAAGGMPDHASVELEFMHYLTAAESTAVDPGERLSFVRAQRDFLRTYLGNWWPLLLTRVNAQDGLPSYHDIVSLSAYFLEEDASHLDAMVLKG